eukprot:5169453-Alexandrium_andersonii.AAC.1
MFSRRGHPTHGLLVQWHMTALVCRISSEGPLGTNGLFGSGHGFLALAAHHAIPAGATTPRE